MLSPAAKISIIVSQGQSRSPDKRGLEEAIATEAAKLGGAEVFVIPHLYDLTADGPSIQRLRTIRGPVVIFSWMFERATHWVLDRLGVHGTLTETCFSSSDDDEEDEVNQDGSEHNSTAAPTDPRPIHCIDLRANTNPSVFIDELERLLAFYEELDEPPITLEADALPNSSSGSSSMLTLAHLFLDDTVGTLPEAEQPLHVGSQVKIEEHPTRRWYPVIDFSRCTNCMECIDFCLFGVYGVDGNDSILVEQPDNCRKGCPACSRVCPANAIIFPQHKTPAIAGAPGDGGSFKIDLSKLFGAPEENEDPLAVAARERDEQLLLAGRPAVGDERGKGDNVATRTTAIKSSWSAEKSPSDDKLDSLIDQLDDLDL